MDEIKKQRKKSRYLSYDTIDIMLIITLVIACFALGALSTFMLRGGVQVNLETLELVKYDKTGPVGCESDSMGLIIGCGDILYQKDVSPKQKLIEGRIYIYKTDEGQSVAHRLVTCLDKNCSKTVFKGDNNRLGEIVYREQIKTEVVMVQYDR